jgi:AIPR protein
MQFNGVEDLIRELSSKSDIEATKGLTRFFAEARFGSKGEDFERHFTDGKDDGGIDFFHDEGAVFYIVQSKFCAAPRATSSKAVLSEIRKIVNTLTNENPNPKADEFINAFRRSQHDSGGLLECIWLTTNDVGESVAKEAQKALDQARKHYGWKPSVDFVPFGRAEVARMISDIRHGYVPYTGKKEVPISIASKGSFIENRGDRHGVYSIVCSVRVTDLLKWIPTREAVNKFLQKNVREYEGDKPINKAIQDSFRTAPDWFWYKHNGVIIFADSVSVAPEGNKLVLRNPQIVNGGQTVTAVYQVFDKLGRKDSDAEVLVRAYRLPYERTETHDEGIQIVKALNSQNPIKPSDLHSTDSRQVRLQELFERLGYKYHRKRSKDAKSGKRSITMRGLALYYFICKREIPHEGVRGQIEEIFSETNKYDAAFPENSIDRELNASHIVLEYALVWRISEVIGALRKELPKRDREYYNFTRFFVLTDLYRKVLDWKHRDWQQAGWRAWKDLVESNHFEDAIWNFARRAFRVATQTVPSTQEARDFFRRKEATEKYSRQAPGRRDLESAMRRASEAHEEFQGT